jgi:Mechanosensitive ion channel, conserved TM helix
VEQFKNGLGDAWASVATFLPKLIGFLLILIIGYFIAKALAKVVDGILERVGFDHMVERGGVGQALAKSRFDASDIVGKLVFYALFLFVLQLAFGVFGPNPVSDLIKGVIAYLPNVLVAVIIIVVGAAIAAAVKEIVTAALGGLSYGKTLAIVASSAILVVVVFAALDQLQIAPAIVRGLFYALLAIVVGSSIVAIGGGGIKTMNRYWERAAQRTEAETGKVKQQAQGAGDRVTQRVEQRKQQIQGDASTSVQA